MIMKKLNDAEICRFLCDSFGVIHGLEAYRQLLQEFFDKDKPKMEVMDSPNVETTEQDLEDSTIEENEDLEFVPEEDKYFNYITAIYKQYVNHCPFNRETTSYDEFKLRVIDVLKGMIDYIQPGYEFNDKDPQTILLDTLTRNLPASENIWFQYLDDEDYASAFKSLNIAKDEPEDEIIGDYVDILKDKTLAKLYKKFLADSYLQVEPEIQKEVVDLLNKTGIDFEIVSDRKIRK